MASRPMAFWKATAARSPCTSDSLLVPTCSNRSMSSAAQSPEAISGQVVAMRSGRTTSSPVPFGASSHLWVEVA